MTPFTTSKGEFIAVPVPDYKKALNDISEIIKENPECFEIIGLSYDISNNEELAKKVVDYYFNPLIVIGTLFSIHNITGNNLIIKKK